jgi:hypothetical protein
MKNMDVLVLQMGKVGSSTLFHCIRDLPGIRAYHLHQLNGGTLRRHIESQKALHGTIPEHAKTSVYVLENIVHAGNPLNIVTSVREPMARNISAFFQNIGNFRLESAVRSGAIDDLIRTFLEKYSHHIPVKWFDRQLREPLGFNVYKHPLTFERGYEILEDGRIRLLIVRSEDDDLKKIRGLADFLDLAELPQLSRYNVGASKEYGEAYRLFKEKFQPPPALLDYLYKSQYANHFYTASEIEAFYAYWRQSSQA